MNWREPSQDLTLKSRTTHCKRWLIPLKIPGNAGTVSDGLDELATC